MWECAYCNRVMFKNSGIHRRIRTKSGNFRMAGLCPGCAARHDRSEQSRAWCVAFGSLGIAGLLILGFFLLV